MSEQLGPEALDTQKWAQLRAMGEVRTEVTFIGGPLRGARAALTKTPPRLVVLGATYERIDDPDTGEFLGGYAPPYTDDKWERP